MIKEKFDIENSNCDDFVCSFSSKNDFCIAFREKFRYLVAYHATNLNTREVADITRNGLRKTSLALLINKAKERFIDDKCINAVDVEKVIDQYFSQETPHTLNEINFGLVKDDLYENYHYLLFGSEALLPVANYLRGVYGRNFREILIQSGAHYIIKVIVPVNRIDNCFIHDIYDYFHNNSFSITLAYNYDLPSVNILKLEKVDRPKDLFNLLFQ